MVRGHGTAELLKITGWARAVRPDTAIAADMIAGFPGETDEEHQQTLALLSAVGFAKLHVFPYYARDGTPAATAANPVEVAAGKNREGEVRDVGKLLRNEFNAQ